MKFKAMETLFSKADTTESKYEAVLEQKQEELLKLQAKLQDQNSMLRDMHKETLLGTISSETYEAEKKKVESLQEKVQEVQKELHMIEVYQTEDIKAVIEELDAEKSKAFVKHQDEFKKLQMELLESKQSYLKKMVEAKAKYDELVAPERKLDALKIKMGIKKNSYIGNAFESLNMVSVGAGYEPLRIDQKEVQDALWYGKIPERLNKVITEEKEKRSLEN